MKIKKEETVTTVFKSNTVMLITSEKLQFSTKNTIARKIRNIIVGDINAEVQVLNLKKGKSVIVIIKSSDIMLGR